MKNKQLQLEVVQATKILLEKQYNLRIAQLEEQIEKLRNEL